MSKIPTAENFLHQSKSLHDMWDNTRGRGEWDEEAIANSHIEFAKLHVEAALKQAEIEGQTNWGNSKKMKDAILNAYPLTNIK